MSSDGGVPLPPADGLFDIYWCKCWNWVGSVFDADTLASRMLMVVGGGGCACCAADGNCVGGWAVAATERVVRSAPDLVVTCCGATAGERLIAATGDGLSCTMRALVIRREPPAPLFPNVAIFVMVVPGGMMLVVVLQAASAPLPDFCDCAAAALAAATAFDIIDVLLTFGGIVLAVMVIELVTFDGSAEIRSWFIFEIGVSVVRGIRLWLLVA